MWRVLSEHIRAGRSALCTELCDRPPTCGSRVSRAPFSGTMSCGMTGSARSPAASSKSAVPCADESLISAPRCSPACGASQEPS